jgi:hypothetical protein
MNRDTIVSNMTRVSLAAVLGAFALAALVGCGNVSGAEVAEVGVEYATGLDVQIAKDTPEDLFVEGISQEAPRLDTTDAIIYGTMICADLALDIVNGTDTMRAVFGAMELDGYSDDEQVAVAFVANVTLCPELDIYDHPSM